MGVHLYTNGAWTDSGKIYRNSLNLFDETNTSTADGYTANNYLKEDGTYGSNTTYDTSIFIPLRPSTTYTLSFSDQMTVYAPSLCLYSNSKVYSRGITYNGLHEITFTTSATEFYVRLSVHKTYSSTYMLNVGETPLPYEPYNVVDWYTNHGHGYSSGAWD